MVKRFVAFSAFAVILILCIETGVFCQDGKGNDPGKNDKKDKSKPPSSSKPPGNKTPPGGKPTPKQPRKIITTTPPRPTPNNPPNPPANNDCAESELLIRCGLQDCNVTVDGKSQGITSLNGELQIAAIRGKRKVVVSKDGYETAQSTAIVACGELERVEVRLKPKPFELQLKTSEPNCEILINDPPVLIGKSDEKGFFKYRIESGTVYVQARKTGYLTDSKSVSPSMAQKEISLKLKPLKARIILNTKAADAFAQSDGDEKKYDLTETILLEPGRRKLIIKALGYAPLTLELDLQPDQKVEKTITLERLPIAELLRQAEQFLKNKSPTEALELCRNVFTTEPHNAIANRLVATIYLEKQDFAKAEPYLLKALNGNETIELKIRRHAGEKFELTSGHDACAGLLLLSKQEVEYRGATVTSENFKVPYSQIQIVGFQLKKNVALHLSLKVADIKGKKKDYNFYFYIKEKELSKEGKLYFEIIQKLIRQQM